MIELTRLNGHPLVINAELIKFVEESPDTVITLVTGDKMIVRETATEVTFRVLAYRRNLINEDSPLSHSHEDHPLPCVAEPAQE
jgi:flagellar protein FlbD